MTIESAVMALLSRLQQEKELEQSSIRVIGGFLVVIYMLIINKALVSKALHAREFSLGSLPHELILSSTYFLVMLILFGLFFLKLASPSILRITSLVFEIAILNFAMVVIPDIMDPVFWLFYWIIIGHAFRFGEKDLLLATGLSFSGFLAVVLFTPYWHEHIIAGVSLLLSLVLIPFYIGQFALRDIHKQEQLEKEKLKANAANEEKSNFLSNVTHELRTPLNGVTAVGELLSNTELNEKQREYVDVITKSSKVLLSLINNILDFSKIESGIIEIEHISFTIPELVNNTITILKPIAQDKGVHLEARIADSVPQNVFGDPTKVSQILMNLVNNAIKFTDCGYTLVNVFPTASTEETITLRFEVIDTGIGISERAKNKIFERFAQEDESVTRKYGGTGLGTAISKMLVEHMGGRIGLSSEVGVGSRFWFEIPFEIRPAIHPVATEQKVVVITQDIASLYKLTETIKVWDYAIEHYSDCSSLAKIIHTGIDKIPAAVIMDYAVARTSKDIITSLDEKIVKRINFILLNPSNFSDKQIIELYDSVLPVPFSTRDLYQTLHFKALTSNPLVTPIHTAQNYRQKPARNTSKLTILVCDDEQTNRYVMQELLGTMGHQVICAENGYQAIDILQKESIDLAILDLQMPEMSGMEVAELYQYANPDRPIPMILATANVRKDIIEKSRMYFKDYIDKPIDYQRLSQMITKICASAIQDNGQTGVDLSREMQVTLFDADELRMYPAEMLEDEFLSSLFATFVKGADKKIVDLKYAIQRQDLESFKANTHALKGMAGNIKAKRLAEIASRCEEISREAFSNAEITACLFTSLENCLKETKHLLFDFLKEEKRAKG